MTPDVGRRTVFITGASRGIGRDLALAFGKAGYAVGINFVKEEAQAKAVAQSIAKAGNKEVELFPGDVRDSLKVRQMLDGVQKRWGRLDVLINNAGITRDRTILKMNNGEWNDVIDTNLSGAFWCLREAARLMCKEKKGAIINIASIMAARPGFGNANYAASKAGLIALTKAAARELGRFQVTVNAVMPGFHETDMSSNLAPEHKKAVIDQHVLGKSTDAGDLCRVILELAQNTSMSGQIVNVDSRLI